MKRTFIGLSVAITVMMAVIVAGKLLGVDLTFLAGWFSCYAMYSVVNGEMLGSDPQAREQGL